MLKIEKLDPKDNVFTFADHAEHGEASLKVKTTAFAGEYHLHEAGTATVACISVANKVASPIDEINLKGADGANINVKLTKKVVREVTVEVGDTAISLPDLWIESIDNGTAGDAGSKAVSRTNEHTLALASAQTGAKEVYRLELTVLVATGVAADDDVADGHLLTLEAGETSAKDVHFDILSNLRVNPGNKPNLTHLSVRGAKLHF